jgi:hypothetical protein
MKIVRRPAKLDHPMLKTVFEYWESKRAGRVTPSRADIVISDLKQHLGWVMVVEAMHDYEDFRYRLVGSKIAEYFLADAHGATMRATYALGEADETFTSGVLRLHRAICTGRCPFLVRSAGGEWRGRVYPSFDALYLPLGTAHASQVMTTYAFAEMAAA